MAKVIEPLYSDLKLIHNFDENTKAVGLVFYHGLGDLIMFLNPFKFLKELYPKITFQLILQDGLSFQDICPNAYYLKPGDMDNLDKLPYDIVAKIHFPMEDNNGENTKAEICCIEELGIPPFSGHSPLPVYPCKIVATHFTITCLPDLANPDYDTAKKIWQEIIDVGFIPLETHFEHAFHNPVNAKFDFIDCTVRKCQPRISTLIGLLRSCYAFVGVVSGNFHTALATMPCSRIMLLEKHLCLKCFTQLPVARAGIKPGEYKEGTVREWLQNIAT